MGCHIDAPNISHKALRFVVLVATYPFLVCTGEVHRQSIGRILFTGPRGLRDLEVHDQGLAIIDDHMTPVARLGWMGVGPAR